MSDQIHLSLRYEKGFTLVEMLVSIAIITIVMGLSLPVYGSFVQSNDLDLATQNLVAMLRRAETYARAVDYDSVWSVEIQSSSIILFQGTTFGTRNTTY